MTALALASAAALTAVGTIAPVTDFATFSNTDEEARTSDVHWQGEYAAKVVDPIFRLFGLIDNGPRVSAALEGVGIEADAVLAYITRIPGLDENGSTDDDEVEANASEVWVVAYGHSNGEDEIDLRTANAIRII